MFHKGDWVVINGLDMVPVQLTRDQYEKEITFHDFGPNSRRKTITVVDLVNPDCDFTEVSHVRLATQQDFLNLYLAAKRDLDSVKKRISSIQDAHHAFLNSTTNVNILD